MNNDDNNQFGNFLYVISIALQLENLELNEKQIRYLDEHLQKQDTKFLQKIYAQNEKIIFILEKLLERYWHKEIKVVIYL